MKKQLLITAVALVLSTTTFGQLTVIPKAGVTLTNRMDSDDVADWTISDPKSKFGFTLGAGLEIGLTKSFAIQPELLFIQKGYKENGSGTDYPGSGLDYDYTSSLTVNYIELPILAKVKFGNFYLNAGPSIGFGIGGKRKWEVTEQGGDPVEGDREVKFGEGSESNVEYIQNAWDFGLQVGGGAKLGRVVIDARYGLGLSNLNDKPASYPDGFNGDWSMKNSTFQLTVGYPIKLGK